MKRSLLVTIAVIVFSLFLVTGAFATVRCVNLTGTAGCYPSIQVAVNASSAGDTVAINPGVYYQGTTEIGSVGPQSGLTLVGAKTTKSGSSIVIMSLALPGQVVLDILPNTFLGAPGSTGDGIDIDSNSPLVTVKNLTVRNVDEVGIYTDADYTTITNVQIFNTYDDGNESAIYIEGNNAKITNCLISGIYGYPIYVDGYNNTLVQNNTIKNVYYYVYLSGTNNSLIGNTINGVDAGDCLDMDGDNGTIKNNTISNCYGDGIYVDTSNGYTITGNKVTSVGASTAGDCMDLDVNNSAISNNTLAGCDGYGIYNDSTSSPYGYNTYTNNIISFTTDAGIYIDDDHPTVKFNSVSNAPEGDCYYLSYSSNCVNGAVISNNTCMNTTYYGFETYFDGATISNNTVDSTTQYGFDLGYCTKISSNNTITGNIARNAGYDTYGGDYGGFYIEGGGNTITSNQAINNPGFGFEIYNYGGTTNVTTNTSSNNGATGLNIEDSTGTVNVTSNTIKNNQGEGLVGDSTAGTLNANTNTVTGNRVDVCAATGGSFNGTFTSNIFSTGGVFTPCDLD